MTTQAIPFIRLMAGDLDGDDPGYLLSEAQWLSLIGNHTYETDDGRDVVNVLNVSIEFLEINITRGAANGFDISPLENRIARLRKLAGENRERYIIDVANPSALDPITLNLIAQAAAALVEGDVTVSSFTFRTTVPPDTVGVDGDRTLVRVPSIAVHAYEKVSGSWERQWAFSGGDSVLLTGSLAVIYDRIPATEPDSSVYTRYVGVSGYSPVTDADIDQIQAVNIDDADDMRGGNRGSNTSARANTLPNQEFGMDLEDFFSNLDFDASFNGIYLWFGIQANEAVGLSIASVSYNGVDIPVTKQADQITRSGNPVDVWVSDNQYSWDDIKDHPFVLVIEQDADAPNTYNRYAVVTQNAEPAAADFLSAGATHSANVTVLLPQSGWEDGRGYLHFALPSGQDAPTIAGTPGGINLIDDFTVRSRATDATVTLNGDTMRTLSSEEKVWQLVDRFGLFPWIVR